MCNVQETLLAAVEAHVLNIDTTDIGGNNTLSRAATRFVVGGCWWVKALGAAGWLIEKNGRPFL